MNEWKKTDMKNKCREGKHRKSEDGTNNKIKCCSTNFFCSELIWKKKIDRWKYESKRDKIVCGVSQVTVLNPLLFVYERKMGFSSTICLKDFFFILLLFPLCWWILFLFFDFVDVFPPYFVFFLFTKNENDVKCLSLLIGMMIMMMKLGDKKTERKSDLIFLSYR